MRHILLATGNRNKVREAAEILGSGWRIECLADHPEITPAEETGATFEENATLKALAASLHFDGMVLADDSGLEVDALGGAPGVRSARYAGEDASDAENVAKLLDELAGVGTGPGARSARFRCVIALARKGTLLGTFEGSVEGSITLAPHGEGGFGYDPVFLPTGSDRTFAEMAPREKHALSHRGRALAALSIPD